nr:MAG TPA: hypothetical protein [Caudoviricetes sp.]
MPDRSGRKFRLRTPELYHSWNVLTRGVFLLPIFQFFTKGRILWHL